MVIADVNQDDFQKEVLDVKGMVVLVDFWAPWCGPCKMQGPILEELADEVEGKAKIVKVNVDDNNDLAGQYGVMSIPALKIFKEGELVAEETGVHQKEALMALIETHSS